MLYLTTLGAVALRRTDGAPISPAAGQQRLLALLSVLSAHGESGISRDRLLLLLWPEGNPDRARHALTQTLYHARRSLGAEDLFLPGTELRLNPERITSDVLEFENASTRGEWDLAARVYRGPFLDDFQVHGAGDFERWASAHRRKLVDRAADVFGRLASIAAAESDSLATIRWRRCALEVDPFNTKAASALIEALLSDGDRIGALRLSQQHEALLRDELGVAPDPAFHAVIARAMSTPASAANVVSAPSASPAEQLSAELQPTPILRSARRRFMRKRIVWSAAAAVAAAGALAVFSLQAARANPQSFGLDQRIVVAPFRVNGTDPSLRFLREGIVELLSTRIGDERSPSAVDPSVVLRAWRSARLPDSPEPSRDQIIRMAERFRAAGVVLGSVVGSPGHMIITASVVRVGETGRAREATVDGPLDSLAVMVDRLAGKLLILTSGQGERFAERITPSLLALHEFLAGQAANRTAAYSAAMRYYESALRIDSTFALAAMHLALVADRINATEQHDRALAIAWANRSDLNARDQAHLTAFAGPRYPEPSTEAEQLAAWEKAVSLSPDRAEAWLELGERFLQSGRLLGVAAYERRAEHALSRAVELDPGERNAQRLLALLTSRRGDSAALRVLVAAWESNDSPMKGLGVFTQWRVGHAMKDQSRLSQVRRLMPELDDGALRAIALGSQYDAIGLGDGERALRIRARRALRASDRLDAILAQHSLALNQGRPIVALDLTEQLQELHPGSRTHLRLRVLDAIYGGGDPEAARVAARALEPFATAPDIPDEIARAVQLADVCVLAQWRLFERSSDGVRGMIARLRAAGVPRIPVPVGANPHTCAALVDAGLSVQSRAPNARATIARVDSLMLGGPAASDASAYAHILIARLWERLGDRQRGLDAIRRRPYLAGWPRYLATARREEGQLATLTGDRQAAAAAFREYLALRHSPEPEVESEVFAVRSAEAALQDEP